MVTESDCEVLLGLTASPQAAAQRSGRAGEHHLSHARFCTSSPVDSGALGAFKDDEGEVALGMLAASTIEHHLELP